MPSHLNLLSAEQSLLLIVDQQPKLTSAMPESDAKAMAANTNKLSSAAGLLNIPVLLTEQYPKGLGSTDPNITANLPSAAQIFTKTGFSCCAAEGFMTALKNQHRQQIILTGQETHVCILQTALELASLDYQVYVAEDAVCSRQAAHKTYALQRMQQQGVTICNYESVLFEWLRDARHPDFKQISNLLR
ncbi:MAG: isochorismatase family protein [Methylococcales bacterium]